jgi:hypothetical protein
VVFKVWGKDQGAGTDIDYGSNGDSQQTGKARRRHQLLDRQRMLADDHLWTARIDQLQSELDTIRLTAGDRHRDQAASSLPSDPIIQSALLG